MTNDKAIFVPSYPIDNANNKQGIFYDFHPGTRVLPAGFQVAPGFKTLPVDVVFDEQESKD